MEGERRRKKKNDVGNCLWFVVFISYRFVTYLIACINQSFCLMSSIAHVEIFNVKRLASINYQSKSAILCLPSIIFFSFKYHIKLYWILSKKKLRMCNQYDIYSFFQWVLSIPVKMCVCLCSVIQMYSNKIVSRSNEKRMIGLRGRLIPIRMLKHSIVKSVFLCKCYIVRLEVMMRVRGEFVQDQRFWFWLWLPETLVPLPPGPDDPLPAPAPGSPLLCPWAFEPVLDPLAAWSLPPAPPLNNQHRFCSNSMCKCLTLPARTCGLSCLIRWETTLVAWHVL